jgi:plastocyanin domain-containing protein
MSKFSLNLSVKQNDVHMKEPKYLSEYLDDFITEEKLETRKNGKINWKLLFLLLLPFGTAILIGLILFKKLKDKNSKT